jgi:beta-lactamase regulating signal transducer with metallopeptidase domain
LILIYGLILIPVLSHYIPLHVLGDAKPVNHSGILDKMFNAVFNQAFRSMAESQSPALNDSAPLYRVIQESSSGLNWSLLVIVVWIAGFLITSFRVVIGKVSLIALHIDESNRVSKKYESLLHHLSERMSIRRKIIVGTSPKCSFPFTYRVFKPVIVFPQDIGNWPVERVKAVMLHELAHIRRNDYLTQYIARIICSLFWFIPPLWIAYASLYQEQEMACDVSVLRRGIKPADYASHILDLARCRRSVISMEGSYFLRGRKKILKKRIFNALSLRKDEIVLKGGKPMKLRNFILLSGILLIAIALIGSCATKRKAVSDQDFFEAYSATWVNEAHQEPWRKVVMYADGTYEYYTSIDSSEIYFSGIMTFTDKWKEADGTIWYRGRWKDRTGEGYEMGKISDSGNTFEQIFTIGDLQIEEWEVGKTGYNYITWYRQ